MVKELPEPTLRTWMVRAYGFDGDEIWSGRVRGSDHAVHEFVRTLGAHRATWWDTDPSNLVTV